MLKTTKFKYMENKTFDELIPLVTEWARERGILQADFARKQMLKVLEEVGETRHALLRNNSEKTKDGIGDTFVTLIILAVQLGYTPAECLATAWEEIKDRKGKVVNGIFVKDESM